jgi:hypothetical protein
MGAAITEQEWAAIVTAGRQAEHEALELVCRPRTLTEWRDPDAVRLHRWAIAVVGTAALIARASGAGVPGAP